MDQATYNHIERLLSDEVTRLKLVAHACFVTRNLLWRMGDEEGDIAAGKSPVDVVTEAIYGVFDGTIPWDPQMGDLFPYLKKWIEWRIRDLVRRRRREQLLFIKQPTGAMSASRRDLADDVAEPLAGGVSEFSMNSDPELLHIAQETEDERDDKVSQIFNAAEEDADLMAVVDAALNVGWQPRFIADELGLSPAEVNNRLKRLRRRVLRTREKKS